MGLFFSNLIQIALVTVWLLVLVRVLLSWVDPGGRSQIGGFVTAATEPILGPVRKVLPPMGAFDLSPLIVLMVLSVLWRLF